MTFPYLTDFVNAGFGTRWHLPIPTFGAIVAIAVMAATYIATRATRGYEKLGRMPAQTHRTSLMNDSTPFGTR